MKIDDWYEKRDKMHKFLDSIDLSEEIKMFNESGLRDLMDLIEVKYNKMLTQHIINKDTSKGRLQTANHKKYPTQ